MNSLSSGLDSGAIGSGAPSTSVTKNSASSSTKSGHQFLSSAHLTSSAVNEGSMKIIVVPKSASTSGLRNPTPGIPRSLISKSACSSSSGVGRPAWVRSPLGFALPHIASPVVDLASSTPPDETISLCGRQYVTPRNRLVVWPVIFCF